MTPTQRYWLMFSPGLILSGFFFGLGGMLFFFVPTFFVYQAHRLEWSILKSTVIFAALLFGSMFALVIID